MFNYGCGDKTLRTIKLIGIKRTFKVMCKCKQREQEEEKIRQKKLDRMLKIKTPEFLKGSIEALKYIKNKGFEIIIITNQYLIGEKIITLRDYQNFNDLFLKILKQSNVGILDVFYCTYARSENCDMRKQNKRFKPSKNIFVKFICKSWMKKYVLMFYKVM